MRADFIRRKLQLITDELGRLEEFRDIGYDDFVADDIRLAAVERILERIVLRAIDVNEHILASRATGDEPQTTRLTYRETFLRLPYYGVLPQDFAARVAASAGLPNIIVHEYNDVDHRIVHAAIRSCLGDYVEYVRRVSAWLDRQEAVAS